MIKTFVIIGSAPSLKQEDIDYIQGKVRTIAINDNYLRAPWAEILYYCDKQWYEWHKDRKEFKEFAGKTATISDTPADWRFTRGRVAGLCKRKDRLNTGKNSAFQALNLARHLGAERVLLMGVDMKPTGHWHGGHPVHTPDSVYAKMLPYWETVRGVEVINCSMESAIECFPKMDIRDVI